jgi:hypothetical protein
VNRGSAGNITNSTADCIRPRNRQVSSEERRDPHFKGEIGGDAKIGLGSALTLDLTVNTDFAQVEVDDEQINLTRDRHRPLDAVSVRAGSAVARLLPLGTRPWSEAAVR